MFDDIIQALSSVILRRVRAGVASNRMGGIRVVSYICLIPPVKVLVKGLISGMGGISGINICYRSITKIRIRYVLDSY
jgi:hypothetical protein